MQKVPEAEQARISSAEAAFSSATAHDAHRIALTLTLLYFLWGAIALAVLGWELFWIRNLINTVVGAAGLVYFVSTWKRPHRRVAEVVSVILPVYFMLVLPWTAFVWCDLRRPMEAFTVPQVCMVTMALVIPGGWRLGDIALAVFAAESLFVFFLARYLGLETLVPISEPFATVAVTILGIGLRMLRRHRRDIAREHVRARAEIVALNRIRPLFVTARQTLEEQVAIVASELVGGGKDQAGARFTNTARALDRLDDLGNKLGDLVVEEAAITSAQDAERRLVERDAQLGAILLAGLGVGLMLLATLWSTRRIGSVPTDLFAATAIVAFGTMIYLLGTHRRPSSRRALWAVLILFATTLPLITYNQFWVLEVGRPFSPFLGHKVLVVVLGLTMATRFKLGMVLIAIAAANAIVLWFVLDLGAHGDIVSFTEPWMTLLYMLIGLVSLRMNEQRQLASIQLLRDEAEGSAMHRRALMLLALRDRLNSPLQTLVLAASDASQHLPASSSERVQAALDRLVDLSRQLGQLDVLAPRPATSLDANHELRRRT